MTPESPSRRVGAGALIPVLALVVLVTLLAAACGSSAPSRPPASAAPGGSGAPGASDPPAAGSPAPSDPGAAILIDDLLNQVAAKDGQVIRVSGNFLADQENGARLCALMMESYPPQCGGGSIRVTGEVPAATLAKLSTTTEPGLHKAWWGYVIVSGTFHASGDDGLPVLELGEIELHEG
jgi:hypothetical protein